VRSYGGGNITRTPAGKFRVRTPDGRGGKLTIGNYPSREVAERMRAAALLERDERSGPQFLDQVLR